MGMKDVSGWAPTRSKLLRMNANLMLKNSSLLSSSYDTIVGRGAYLASAHVTLALPEVVFFMSFGKVK